MILQYLFIPSLCLNLHLLHSLSLSLHLSRYISTTALKFVASSCKKKYIYIYITDHMIILHENHLIIMKVVVCKIKVKGKVTIDIQFYFNFKIFISFNLQNDYQLSKN